MKRILVLTIVVALLAATVAPALAAGSVRSGGNAKGGKIPFALAGVIVSTDPVAGTVTVTVACGNKLVKPYIGQSATLKTTATTRFLLRNPNGTATVITFAELVAGQKISAQGRLANGVWTVTRITSGAKLTCLK